MKLTPKQKRFCEEYIKDLNATQAYIRAGYSARSADSLSSRMMGNDRISLYIAELQEKITNANILDATQIQELLSDRIKKGLNQDGLKAVDILNKMQGNYSLDKVEKEVTIKWL